MVNFQKPDAIACLQGRPDGPRGTVRFYEGRCCVTVEIEVSGLEENGTGFFGLHIHTGRSCTGDNFSDSLDHFDPEGKPHPLHAGDLPPLLRQRSGKAYLKVCTDRFRLCQVLGRTVVLHAMADDFQTQPAGNTGEKLACGRILPVSKKCLTAADKCALMVETEEDV